VDKKSEVLWWLKNPTSQGCHTAFDKQESGTTIKSQTIVILFYAITRTLLFISPQ